jgi:hypothetical protein
MTTTQANPCEMNGLRHQPSQRSGSPPDHRINADDADADRIAQRLEHVRSAAHDLVDGEARPSSPGRLAHVERGSETSALRHRHLRVARR